MTTSVTPADTVQTRSVSYVNAQLTVDLRDETVPAAPAASEALVDEAEKSTEVQTAGKSVPLAQLWRYRSRSDAIKVRRTFCSIFEFPPHPRPAQRRMAPRAQC